LLLLPLIDFVMMVWKIVHFVASFAAFVKIVFVVLEKLGESV
jgi:hypothetical protein